jgi:hypothetical protein
MITLRIKADVQNDRRVIVTLPPEVPTGPAELVVTVESPNGKQSHPRGVPAAVIRGIAAGNGPPPDDETVEKWMHERRTEKYG